MRTWTLLLLALSLAAQAVAQDNSTRPDLNRFTGYTLPVEVSKTIKAEKASAGDPVEFQMLEPVLAGNGVVISEKAKLFGRVVLATGAHNGQYSYLALVIDRAEWDGQTLPMNAFLVGWGSRRVARSAAANCAATVQAQVTTRRSPATVAQSQGSLFDQCTRMSRGSERAEPANWSHKLIIRDIDIYRDANSGSTVLLSRKNIHLPTGMLVVLQNVEEGSLAATKR